MHKLDAECDRQATVVSRLMTTLGDDRRAVVSSRNILSAEVGEKLQRELRFLEIFEFRICLINIPQLQVLQSRSFGSSGGTLSDTMHWLDVLRTQ